MVFLNNTLKTVVGIWHLFYILFGTIYSCSFHSSPKNI